MGIPRPKRLESLTKLDADLKVRCGRCGRSAVFELLPVLNHFRAMGWNTSFGAAGRHFRCRGTTDDPGCGSKAIELTWVPRDRPKPPEPRISAREAARLARKARG